MQERETGILFLVWLLAELQNPQVTPGWQWSRKGHVRDLGEFGIYYLDWSGEGAIPIHTETGLHF